MDVESGSSSSKWPGCVLQSLKGASMICNLINLEKLYKRHSDIYTAQNQSFYCMYNQNEQQLSTIIF